jgi:hypothetical protein
MTVPFTFGWQQIAVVVALVLVAGVLAFVALAAGRATSGRSEWQAWLDGRSAAPVQLPASGTSTSRLSVEGRHPVEE